MNLVPFYPLAKPWLNTYRRFARPVGDASAFRVLTFHDVSEKNYSGFKRVVEYLKVQHRILSPSEVESVLDGRIPGYYENTSNVPCLVTFDDGYASNARVAQDILNVFGIKAIFFVCPSLLDLQRERQPEAISKFMFEGKKRVPEGMEFMSWSDLENLSRAGHTIGSHTLLHRRLTSLTYEQQKEEIVQSGEILNKRLGKPCTWFAYPFGTIDSIDTQAHKIIAESYRYCCSGIRGLNTKQTSRLALRRDSVELDAPFEYQLLSLCGGLDFLYGRAAKRLGSITCSQG